MLVLFQHVVLRSSGQKSMDVGLEQGSPTSFPSWAEYKLFTAQMWNLLEQLNSDLNQSVIWRYFLWFENTKIKNKIVNL